MIDTFCCFQIRVVIRPGRPSRPRSASGRRCGSPAGRSRAARSRTRSSEPWALSSTGQSGRDRGRSSTSLLVTSGRRGRFLRLLRGRRRARRTRGPTTSFVVSSFKFKVKFWIHGIESANLSFSFWAKVKWLIVFLIFGQFCTLFLSRSQISYCSQSVFIIFGECVVPNSIIP